MKARLLLATVAALALIVVAGTGGANATGANPPKSGTVTKDCINSLTGLKEGTITYDGPLVVWPPNHKYVTATISVTDDDAEPVTDQAMVAVTGTHDQILDDGSEMTGSGNTDPATDVKPGPPGTGTPTAMTTVDFRAERSGHKWTDGGDAWRGRTYTFTVMGSTDNNTSMCNPVTFTAVVPHDQGNHTGSSTTTTTSSKKKMSASAKARALRLSRAR